MGKGGWSFLTRNRILQRKKDCNRSRNLCFIIKTIYTGIDGLKVLKVDTQVLKLLRIFFVEHLVIFRLIIHSLLV